MREPENERSDTGSRCSFHKWSSSTRPLPQDGGCDSFQVLPSRASRGLNGHAVINGQDQMGEFLRICRNRQVSLIDRPLKSPAKQFMSFCSLRGEFSSKAAAPGGESTIYPHARRGGFWSG